MTAETLEESELAFVDRLALIELIKVDPSIGLELMRALGEELLQMRRILAQHLRRSKASITPVRV